MMDHKTGNMDRLTKKLCLQIEAFLKVSTKKNLKKISGIFH